MFCLVYRVNLLIFEIIGSFFNGEIVGVGLKLIFLSIENGFVYLNVSLLF